ncbi:NTP/NDP exchange transporter [sulfur-oxidizing endosymbiont of Gigantopelta aegis]|uniref:NTP/NDP exchange transporter n=1 Tax=sulfur-oxidizing endosymbiont of Gigantopelta aegis TaxID=2794934 RepID=UPI0018DB5ED1|nr:Npt1/Npt2 family nucleotide transporter [sulfur-oxidizing endosymbiont of Gigantopelta aegis]
MVAEHTSLELNRIEKILGVFTDVKAGEGTTAILMFANVFLILCAYYFVKPLREGWIAISDIEGLTKMEVKAYSSFLQAIFLLFIMGWYSQLSDRWSRSALVTRSTLFCISNMIVFWFLQPGFFFEGLPVSGIIFYLWVGMFGVFVVAQFWTFCADIYNDEVGKRLLPLIAIGATSGAVFGSKIIDTLVGSGLVPTEALLLAGTAPLFASIILTRIVEQRLCRSRQAIDKQEDDKLDVKMTEIEKAKVKKQGFSFLLNGVKLVFKSRFLFAIAIVTLLTNWVNTNGENLLFRVIQEDLAIQAAQYGIVGSQAILEFTRDGTTAFYGNFFFWVNVVALLLQALIASRLLKYGGFGAIIMLLPVIALLSYSVMALLPILLIVKMMKIAENATDYSVNNTARHVLWLPVDSVSKFHGKPAIDTLYVRIGDGLAALTVLIGVQFLSLTTAEFFIINIILIFFWLYFTRVLIQERKKLL